MVGHVRVPGLTGDEPASISRAAVTGLLRGDLGFDGLVLTDDLGAMRAIRDEVPASIAAARAVAAGVDMPLVPVTALEAVVDAVTSAVANSEVTESQVTASSNRVLRARVGASCG
jgi:beta-N-acetylhexosaminidase